MNDETAAYHAFSAVSSRQGALDWWQNHSACARGTTLIVSHEDPSTLNVPVRRSFGRTLLLLSLFSSPNLTVLNDRIMEETIQTGSSSFSVDSLIAFDTNAASFLRKVFTDRQSEPIEDLRIFLRAIGGNKINWDIRSYLHENAAALLSRHNDRHIYETVLAGEKFAAMDVDEFVRSGRLTTIVPAETLVGRACTEIADFLAKLQSGWSRMIDHRREAFYAALLYMAILQRAHPSERHATRKLKDLIRFMHSEFSSLFLIILWTAWRWFCRDRRAAMFNRLQPGGKDPIGAAANISWDLYHMTQQPGMIMTSRIGGDVLIPAFLTADKPLANLWQLYPLRSCWSRWGLDHPFCVPAIDVGQELLSFIKDDQEFSARFLSVQAHEARRDRLRTSGKTSLRELIERLEGQLRS